MVHLSHLNGRKHYGQVLHGSATTTEAVRRAIQNGQESLRALSQRYGINQKSVVKWKKRASQADLKTGPKVPPSTVLSRQEEETIVAFRRHTLLPLDECLYTLQPTITHLADLHCTDACNDTGFRGYQMSKATSSQRSVSRPIRSAISISILLRCRQLKARSISLWLLTGHPSMPSLNSILREER